MGRPELALDGRFADGAARLANADQVREAVERWTRDRTAAEVTELVICPAMFEGKVYGAIELGFFRRVGAAELDLAARVADAFAVSLRTAQDRRRLEVLLMTTQQQSEELQTQQKELRVTNEELEEQSSALRASRAQLENQQEELQQSNTQLSRLAQELEHQRDELAKSQTVLIDKANFFLLLCEREVLFDAGADETVKLMTFLRTHPLADRDQLLDVARGRYAELVTGSGALRHEQLVVLPEAHEGRQPPHCELVDSVSFADTAAALEFLTGTDETDAIWAGVAFGRERLLARPRVIKTLDEKVTA